jgi:hypothetical protein
MEEEVFMVFAEAKKIEEAKQADSFVDTWDSDETIELENENHKRNRSVDMLIEPDSSREIQIRETIDNEDPTEELKMEFFYQHEETNVKTEKVNINDNSFKF